MEETHACQDMNWMAIFESTLNETEGLCRTFAEDGDPSFRSFSDEDAVDVDLDKMMDLAFEEEFRLQKHLTWPVAGLDSGWTTMGHLPTDTNTTMMNEAEASLLLHEWKPSMTACNM